MAVVLVVDDYCAGREALAACLVESGHSVLQARSGEEALEIAGRELPDLVVLDVMLSKMNGFETTRRLKELAQDRPLPVILATGLSDQTSRLLGLRSGADEY